MKKWTVILLYPESNDPGADLFVDTAEAEDPFEAVRKVQQMAADLNNEDWADEDNPPPYRPGEFRPVGVIEGCHTFVADATHFEYNEEGNWAPMKEEGDS